MHRSTFLPIQPAATLTFSVDSGLSPKDAVSLLDLGEITNRYRRGRGPRAYHIRMLLPLLLYAYRLVYGRFRRAQIRVTAR